MPGITIKMELDKKTPKRIRYRASQKRMSKHTLLSIQKDILMDAFGNDIPEKIKVWVEG